MAKAKDGLENQAHSLARIAAALERLAPPGPEAHIDQEACAFVWEPGQSGLVAVALVAGVPLDLLKGIDFARATLLENTRRFSLGLAANNALLWKARGMGKSSLVKAVHAHINATYGDADRLVLVEIHREEIASLPLLLRLLRSSRAVFFCSATICRSIVTTPITNRSRRHLKVASRDGLPGSVLCHLQRGHLLPREMMDNERSTAINPVRGGRGKSLAVGPLRTVADLPCPRPGR